MTGSQAAPKCVLKLYYRTRSVEVLNAFCSESKDVFGTYSLDKVGD